jgi:hypothetical protein
MPHLLIGLILVLIFCQPAGAQPEINEFHASLELTVHFLNPGGEDVVVNPGSYYVEPAEEWIRLISGERTDAILIQAQPITHGEKLDSAQLLSVPGEADRHHLLILFPNGTGLESVGTYSGIRPRGGLATLSPATRTAGFEIDGNSTRATLHATGTGPGWRNNFSNTQSTIHRQTRAGSAHVAQSSRRI